MDRQQDEHDAEFESFLRQFQPRTPPALKANRRMMLAQLAVAAGLMLAFALPVLWLRDRSAAPNSPGVTDVGLPPQPAAANKIAAPSAPAAASTTVIIPRPGPVAQNGPLRVGGAISHQSESQRERDLLPKQPKAAGIEGCHRWSCGWTMWDALVLQSVPKLDEAAINSVLQWQYEPTLLNGIPVEVEMNVTVSFTLH